MTGWTFGGRTAGQGGLYGSAVARSNGRRRALLVFVALAAAACNPSSTTPADVAPDPGTASAIDGRFEVRFTVDRTTLRPGDDITGTAELWLRAGTTGALSGSSELFGFEFAEVGGSHRGVTPTLPADCSPHQVGLDAPLTSPIVKTGGTGGANDGFAREFLKGRAVHLPTGVWDITAIAGFYDGRSCSGQLHTMRATVRVRVNG